MCGIAGVIGTDLPEQTLGVKARDTMRHRGPDDAGCFRTEGAWLASRRLAIIDVGEPGHQPLADAQTGVTIVFNGEIFNYIELRHELEAHGHRFAGRSDTEVLLRAYLEWGSECLSRLNGMWAFVVWDPRDQSAFVSRDRFGIKPLFFSPVRGGIAFASEPKVLLELYPHLRRPDEVSIARLLSERLLYVDGRSFYEGISVFPPAHRATVRPGDTDIAPESFWRFPDPDRDGALSWTQAKREFEAALEDSVRIRLRSDVPLGITLSGGLDSTALLTAMRRALGPEPEIRAYTSVYEERDASGARMDERDAALVAAGRGGRSTVREVPAADWDLLSVLRSVVWHMDGPGISPAVFPLWGIMQTAHGDGVKVLLEGQGADEILGGYSTHLAAAIIDGLSRALQERSARAAGEALLAARGILGAFPGRRVAADSLAELIPLARAYDQRRRGAGAAIRRPTAPTRPEGQATIGDHRGSERLRRRLIQDFTRDLLPGFLHYGDAISMAHSVESRLPYLDHRLVELCFRLPGDYKIRGGRTKAPLRSYLSDAGQRQIAQAQRKRGYPTPANQWMASDGGAVLRELLLDNDAETHAYVEPHALERLIDRHAAGRFAAGDVLFGLLCTELWLKECVACSSE